MKLMSLDVSSTATGVAIMDIAPNGKLTLLETGLITTNYKRPIGERADKYIRDLFELLELHKPDEVVKEATFQNRNVRASILLNKWEGHTEYAVWNYGITHIPAYSPTAVKKAVTGNGRASKQLVAEMLSEFIDVDVEGDMLGEDITDAIGVGLTHLHKQGRLFPRSIYEEMER